MNATNPNPNGGGAPVTTGTVSGPIVDALPPWFLHQKISIPDPVTGHLNRAELMERSMPTRRRLTVLNAPGGFGKTTLLAECCRHLRDHGTPTAWISLDELDEPAILATYITAACQRTGLEIPDEPNDSKASAEPEMRVGLLVRAVEALGTPFVLALDELDRLSHRGSVALLDFLLQRGSPNLHVAFTCRQLPDGTNIAGAVLEGRATVLAANELRFSRSEIAEFFDLRLSRSELATLATESAGWPIALRISRNKRECGTSAGARAMQVFADNWIESRLWEGLAAADRDFLLDIGLFEWMDADLLDEVLERKDSMLRIATMPELIGLLDPVRGGEVETWRLHPLIRDHCIKRRFRETPERFRAVHRRIATALVGRGEMVAAMRHAAEAGEPALVAEIFENAGGVRLWIGEGLVQLRAADRLLSREAISNHPRLALARCVVLVMTGRLEEARSLYRSLAATLRERAAVSEEADFDLSVDDSIVRGAMALYGGEPLGSEWSRSVLVDFARLADSPRVDSLTRGQLEFGLCIAHQMQARFDAALERAQRARRCLGARRYLTILADLQVGQAAMAQGRVHDAREHYLRAQRVAKATFVLDSTRTVICKTFLQELALECNQNTSGVELPHMSGTLVATGTAFSTYAAASATMADVRLREKGVDSAIAALERVLEFVRGAELPALVRYVSALQISLLAIAGRVGDAERSWRLEGLPETPDGCLDLTGQSWRELEALSCTRLRVLIASGRFDEGRCFSEDVRAVAAARGLRRTLMRALSLSIVLEHRAGNLKAAAGHLLGFLRLLDETPYVGSLVREREACAAVVSYYLGAMPDAPRRQTAQSLLAMMHEADEAEPIVLSNREKEVLLRLMERQRDKEIATALGLTLHGVRYHIRNLFSKLGARTRSEAVRRATEMGLVLGVR